MHVTKTGKTHAIHQTLPFAKLFRIEKENYLPLELLPMYDTRNACVCTSSLLSNFYWCFYDDFSGTSRTVHSEIPHEIEIDSKPDVLVSTMVFLQPAYYHNCLPRREERYCVFTFLTPTYTLKKHIFLLQFSLH